MAKKTVDHPDHYNQLGIECIDVVENFNFNVGNAIKYLWRAGLKDDTKTVEDYEKALWYIRRELERLGKSKVTDDSAGLVVPSIFTSTG